MDNCENPCLDFPATRRNAGAIAAVLQELLAPRARPHEVLEIASGSGQHAVHMVKTIDGLIWWPTDIVPEHLASIDAWSREAPPGRIKPAQQLDVTGDTWLERPRAFDAVVCCNMIHVAPWSAAQGLFRQVRNHIKPDGFLYFYGPFKRDGQHTSASNEAFDRSLRAQNPSWGVRDLTEVKRLADGAGLGRCDVVEMPSNNLSVVFRRD